MRSSLLESLSVMLLPLTRPLFVQIRIPKKGCSVPKAIYQGEGTNLTASAHVVNELEVDMTRTWASPEKL